ncbi:hypothetical protein IGI37_000886 [Enterococcus sp. AZ194]
MTNTNVNKQKELRIKNDYTAGDASVWCKKIFMHSH